MNSSRDTIVIIILTLLVAFIIGFLVVQLIDNKLTNININLPTSMVDRIVDKHDVTIKLKDGNTQYIENKQDENKLKIENLTMSSNSNNSSENSLSSEVTDNDSIYLSNVPYLIDKTHIGNPNSEEQQVKIIENRDSELAKLGKENASVVEIDNKEICYKKPIELDPFNQYAHLEPKNVLNL